MSDAPSVDPAPVAPAPAPPPKQRSSAGRIILICVGLVVLACTALQGWVMYTHAQQDQLYQAGLAAYLKADCAAAADPLGKVVRGEPGSASRDIVPKAKAHLQECDAWQAAAALAQQGQPGEAVLRYRDFLAKYPASPLAPAALAQGKALLATSKPGEVATDGVCRALPALAAQQLLAAAAEPMPTLLFACGLHYELAKQPSEALEYYTRFRREYPAHGLAAQVQTAYARAALAEAQAGGAGALPPPQATRGRGAGAQVEVVIRNDSPEPMSIVFSGPEVRVEELAACTTCERFTSPPPAGCPEKGPVGRYLLAPGSYDVVVKTTGERRVSPFRGAWTLDGAQGYASCFYLVTR
jgi:hypothetical protein